MQMNTGSYAIDKVCKVGKVARDAILRTAAGQSLLHGEIDLNARHAREKSTLAAKGGELGT